MPVNKENDMNLKKPPITNKFTYENLERVTLPEGRFYVDPNGNKLHSVTTILSETSDNSFLLEWRARVGDEYADKVVKQACDLGTLMHTHLENYVQDIPRPSGNNLIRVQAEKMADKIIQYGIPTVDEIWGMEVPLYFPQLYAGTTDLVGIHNGDEAIMDYKTAKKMKKRENIENYFCQAAAYALAHNEIHGTNIQKGVIFMVDRNFQYKEFVVEGVEFEKFQVQWLERVEKFLEMKNC